MRPLQMLAHALDLLYAVMKATIPAIVKDAATASELNSGAIVVPIISTLE